MAVPLLTVTVLAGCGSNPSFPTPTLFLLPTLPPATELQGTQPTSIPPIPEFALTPTADDVETEGPCDHLLWPLHDGARWTYQVSGLEEVSSLELTSSIEAGGAHLRLGDSTAELNCVDGAVIGLPPGWLGSGHPLLGTDVQGLNPRGAILAEEGAILTLGTPWDLEVDAGGSIMIPIPGGTRVPIIGGKVVIFSLPAPLEPIDTLVGKLMALPVHQDVLYQITVQLPDGSQKDMLINTAMQQYYVEQIGLVRVIFEGGAISTTDGSIAATLEPGGVLEITSFDLP